MSRNQALICIFGLLPLLAHARREAPAAAELDPEILKQLPCTTTPPTGYALGLGYGRGNRTEALREARDDAREKLLEQTSAGYSDMRRAAIERHIRDWNEGAYADRHACANVAVASRYIESFASDARKLEEDLGRLAAEAAESAEGSLLQIDAPIWASSGCVADVGRHLTSYLRNALAAQGRPVRVLPAGEPDPSARRLHIELQPSPAGVVVTALLLTPGERGGQLLPGFTFPLDLLAVGQADAGECRGDEALGLEGGEKHGNSGLRVWIELPTSDGFVCEGRSVYPVLRVSQPARVRVFSVEKSGEALLVWPPPGQEDALVSGQVALGELRPLKVTPGDERLVAVAAPAGAHLGKVDQKGGFCRLDGGVHPGGAYSASAAVGTATYSIIPAGSAGCPWVEGVEEEIRRTQELLEGLPPCGL